MQYSLAIIGHPEVNIQMDELISNTMSGIIVNQIDVVSEKDIYKAQEQIKNIKCDGLLFCAEDIYYIFKNKFNIEIPSAFLKHSRQELCKSLFNIGYIYKNDLSDISIDYVNYDYVLNTLKYLGIPNYKDYKIHSIPTNLTDIDLVEHIYNEHIKHYNLHNCVCVTYFTEVYNRLNTNKIPTVYVSPDKEDIIKNINHLRATSIRRKRNVNNHVIIYITLSNLNEHIILNNSEHSVISENYRIAEEIFWFAEKLNGTSITVDSKKHYIFTDSDSFEKQTGYFSSLSIMEKIAQKSIMHCSIGVGYAKNQKLAMKHAQIGNIRAANENQNAAYIVYDANKIAGPMLASNNQRLSSNKIYDLKIDRIAEKSSLSINTIYSIFGYMKSEKTSNLSSNDIALALNVTQRSANRVIAKLLDADAIELAGQKSDGGKGRPINIYKFLL